MYKTVSLHFTSKCMENCPFCYRKKDMGKEKDLDFFINLIPFLRHMTGQIALGGGEPLMEKGFIKVFSKKCKDGGLICNITTNGKEIINLTEKELIDIFSSVTMVSVSFDRWKWGKELNLYRGVMEKLKNITITGVNFLIDDIMIEKSNLFYNTLLWLFETIKVDRVFCLYPKNMPLYQDIRKLKPLYDYFTKKYKHFYIDELTKKILSEGYDNWEEPCHYGKDMISVDERGYVYDCSFDEKSVLHMTEPEDILKIKDYKFEERRYCPFLNYRGNISE